MLIKVTSLLLTTGGWDGTAVTYSPTALIYGALVNAPVLNQLKWSSNSPHEQNIFILH